MLSMGKFVGTLHDSSHIWNMLNSVPVNVPIEKHGLPINRWGEGSPRNESKRFTVGQKGHGGIRGVQGDTSDLKEGVNMKFNV